MQTSYKEYLQIINPKINYQTEKTKGRPQRDGLFMKYLMKY